MSAEEIADAVRLPSHQLEAVQDWLKESLKASHIELIPSGDYLVAHLPSDSAASLTEDHERM